MGTAHSLIGFAAGVLFALVAGAHPAHDSYTEVGWNQAGDTLEVSMRIIPEELETALAWQSSTGSPVALENKAEANAAVEAYLAAHFQIRNDNSELMPVTLVGMDINYAESWLYFTVAAQSNQQLYLRNSMLLELEEQQVNRVRRLWRSPGDVYLHSHASAEQLLWDGR